MLYSEEKIKSKLKKLLRLYKDDLTIDDFFELIPQEMEIAEITKEDSTGEEKHEAVVIIITKLIDASNITWGDKELLKELVPRLIHTIAKGSRQYFAINRSNC